ncbi:MAG: ParB/RepB/Spo0J family partition protein [Leptospiraceae bacterium]|nr:ParB/RepB/Spo0J family partition protein [Leptospiraceae bacterium]
MSKKSEFASLDLLSAFKDPKKSDTTLDLNEVMLNPDQPRILGKDNIKDLVDSISNLGLLEPIIVRPLNGKYMIIAGERRFRAVQELGWKEISAKILDVNSEISYEMALAENERRKSLNPWEVGKAIQYLRKEMKKTVAQVAEILGYTERYIKQLSSIAKLDQKSVENLIDSGKDPSVKNLENLLKAKDGGKNGGETISPSPKKISVNIYQLPAKKREAFIRELNALKRKYGLD